jgi:hypothetical protein
MEWGSGEVEVSEDAGRFGGAVGGRLRMLRGARHKSGAGWGGGKDSSRAD